jgi:peroxiredoxin
VLANFTALLCLAAIAAAPEIAPGAAPDSAGQPHALRYRGTLEQQAGDGAGATKEFDLYCVVARDDAGKQNLTWQVEERGGGGWAWPERFGRAVLGAEGQRVEGGPIQVLHSHAGSQYPVELRTPVFESAGKLGRTDAWTEGDVTFEVLGTQKKQDRLCHIVEVTGPRGHRETVAVDTETGRIVELERRLFLGRGDRYELTMELAGTEPLAAADATRIGTLFNSLVDLQKDLKRRADETSPVLHQNQLEAAATALAPLVESAKQTPLETLVADADKDVREQLERDQGLGGLAKKLVGQPAPPFTLESLDGKKVSLTELTEGGRIVLLHFWKYHDDPLTEPYGQVGYLDFLRGKREKLGVTVLGVAVDEQLGDAATAPAVRRAVRKLAEFMNLGYPVLLDDGDVLGKYGDPRTLGGALPLWVVIAPDGTVKSFKSGYYQVERDRGLEELDQVLIDLIRARRAAQEKK